MTAADLKIGKVGHGARTHRLYEWNGELLAACGTASDKNRRKSAARVVEGKTVADIDCAKCAKDTVAFLAYHAKVSA